MFEAKLDQAGLLKHVLDAIKELVTDVNFDCDEDGMKLQAMDNSHVALVALQLRASGFSQYRCDRQMTLGINVPSFQKITRCAANEDILTLRAYDDGDVLSIVSETLNADRVAEYEMKMMDIDIEHLGIPETRYDAEVALPSSEFNRIIKDLKEMGESIRIEATKEGVKFSASGDIGTGAVMLKHNAIPKKAVDVDKEDKKVIEIDSDAEQDEDDQEDEDGDVKVTKVKKEKKLVIKDDPDDDKTQVAGATQDSDEEKDVKPKANGAKGRKKKVIDSDDDEEEPVEVEKEEDDEEDEEEDDEEEGPKSKKRKLSTKKKAKKTKEEGKAKATKGKGKADKDKEKEEDDLSVSISLQQSVSLTFSIKYLSNFTKATPLAKRLTLHMSNEVPLLVAYEFETGYVRYYLAPKIEDD